MKLFTLSAVCVLVFGLMIALNGTTRFTGHSEQEPLLALEEANPLVSSVWDTAPGTGRAYPRILDWDDPGERSHTPGPAQKHEAGTRARPVPLVGILFILLWIFVSVRLLSAD